jgi:hypothetical protein
MPSQATVTAKAGPALTVTSLVLTNLTKFELSLAGKSMLYTESDQGKKEFDINATSTLTCTIAAGVATIVVSQ